MGTAGSMRLTYVARRDSSYCQGQRYPEGRSPQHPHCSESRRSLYGGAWLWAGGGNVNIVLSVCVSARFAVNITLRYILMFYILAK